MEETTTKTEGAPPPPRQPNEVIRPTDGRFISGLSAGLAQRFDVPVFLVRAVFVVMALGGGLGVALYAAGWFLTRSEDEVETPAQRVLAGDLGIKSWLGIALVLVAFLIFLESFSFLSGGFIWALSLLVVGILLYTVDLPEINRPKAVATDTEQSTDDVGVVEESTAVLVAEDGTGGPGRPVTPGPTPPQMPAPKRTPKERSILGQLTIGLVALGLGVLALFDNTTDLVSPDAHHYVALGLTILGVGLLVGTIVGRARWLILLGILALPMLAASVAWDWGWTSDGVDVYIAPATFDELAMSYNYDVGEIRIDLTDLPWKGQNLALEVSLDAGSIDVLVPRGVGLKGTAFADVGRVSGPAGESFGIGHLQIFFDEKGSLGNVDLNLSLDVGNIEVEYR